MSTTFFNFIYFFIFYVKIINIFKKVGDILETIDYNDLNFIDNDLWEFGSFGTLRRCIFNGKYYACKTFKDPSYLNSKRRKISQISKVECEKLIVPKFWVHKNGKTDTYLTLLKDNCWDIGEKKENIFNQLKDSKDNILKMHEYKIIHGDLSLSNIIVKNDDAYIIDFDNASYNGSKINLKDANDFTIQYVENFGVNKALDVYLFNLITFSLINNIDIKLVRSTIAEGNYGYFDSKDAIKICNQSFLQSPYSDKDFLIDTIDETTFSI